MNKNAVVVFAKNPRLGFCKTRLAKTIGDQKAMDFFIESMSHISVMLAGIDIDVYVFFAGDLPDKDSITAEIWKNAEWRKQLEGDLGIRMYSAFENVFALGYEKILLMGTDCPEVSALDILQGFKSLEENEVVFGPAYDGGYYLVGFGDNFNEDYKRVFEDIEWSTEVVLEKSLERCKEVCLNVDLLEEREDVDYYEDLQGLVERTGKFKEFL